MKKIKTMKKRIKQIISILIIISILPINSFSMSLDNTIKQKVCYLTFDDGPSQNTLKILNILKQYNIKATFFVVGSEKIEYVKQIYDEGHAVGLHTDTHEYSIYKDIYSYFVDLINISNKVEYYIGTKSNIMRFAGGSSNSTSIKYCLGIMSVLTKYVENLGYTYFDWNVSSGDGSSNNTPKDTIVNNVLTQTGGREQICVLMHDAPLKTTTVKALPEVISGLIQQGYTFDVLSKETPTFHHIVVN